MPQVLKEGGKNLSRNNWKVYHPSGKHMFTCGDRKAEWYLSRGLAEHVGDYEIKLTFMPKGDGFKDGETFGLSGREVRCVVSAETEGLQRHHIVPYCYRTHFPEEYKTKNHHDVVLVTYKIHQEYEQEATKFKDKIAEMYDVKTLKEYNLEYTKVICAFSENKIKTVSKLYAIFGSYSKIPQEIIRENLKFVAKQVNLPYSFLAGLNYIQLYKLYLILKEEYDQEISELKSQQRTTYDHGYHVVKELDTHEKIEDFVKMWRAHFIQTMKPKYMPEGWSIDFRCRVEI
jgi:hypothetical protein